MKNLTLLLFICFTPLTRAALLTIDDSAVLSQISDGTPGSQGDLVLDPSGVIGWANYGNASYTPNASGGTSITASSVGSFTLGSTPSLRFSDSWGGSNSDTIAFNSTSGTGLATNEGFRFSLVPNSTGTYSCIIHIADYRAAVSYAVTQGGNAVGSGAISAFSNTAGYDEGAVYFNFTVQNATEAAATWNFDILSGGGVAVAIGGISFLEKSDPCLEIESSFYFSNNYEPEVFQIPFTNTGDSENLVITSVTPQSTDSAYFSIHSFTSPITPANAGTIDFTFDPSDGNRTYTTKFIILSNDSKSPSIEVNLSIIAQNPSAIDLGRIICIGDSISEGNTTRPNGDGNWAWRYWFWENLVDFNIGNQFVGTRTANYNGSSTYPNYNGETFLNKHESIWGTQAKERASHASTYLGNLAAIDQTPDTGIIFLGGNDIPLNLTVSAATVRNRIKTIVDHLQNDLGNSGNPQIRILIVSVLPRFTGSNLDVADIRNNRFKEINDLLKILASNETTPTSEVLFLDLEPLFSTPPGLLYDGIHPNGTGEQLCGNSIFAALVPDMPAIQAHIESINSTTGLIDISVRSHGPRNVRIEETTQLSSNTVWSICIPAQLNSGEWETMSITESITLLTNKFYRAIAEEL